jgi:hypothetical protein
LMITFHDRSPISGSQCLAVGTPEESDGIIHRASMAGLFFLQGFLFLFDFTQSSRREYVDPEGKINTKTRYPIYGFLLTICAVAILVSLFLSPAASAFLDTLSITFIIETIGFWAIGLGWLTKGRVFTIAHGFVRMSSPRSSRPYVSLDDPEMESFSEEGGDTPDRP